MNALVSKYAKGKPIAERHRLLLVWNRLEKTVKEDGEIPTFAKVAVLFIREMRVPASSTTPSSSKPRRKRRRKTKGL